MKPLPLQLSQQLVVPKRLSQGSPVPLGILARFLKRNRIDVGIIPYVISVERMDIYPETVLIRSLWKNLRRKRLPRGSLQRKYRLISLSERENQAWKNIVLLKKVRVVMITRFL